MDIGAVVKCTVGCWHAGVSDTVTSCAALVWGRNHENQEHDWSILPGTHLVDRILAMLPEPQRDMDAAAVALAHLSGS